MQQSTAARFEGKTKTYFSDKKKNPGLLGLFVGLHNIIFHSHEFNILNI